MRRLVISFFLVTFVFTISNNSIQMFCIEQGCAYSGSYNLSHILSLSKKDNCNYSEQYDRSFSSSTDYNHSHVILLNSLAKNESDITGSLINVELKGPICSIQHYLPISIVVNTLLRTCKLKFPSPQIASTLRNEVLLI